MQELEIISVVKGDPDVVEIAMSAFRCLELTRELVKYENSILTMHNSKYGIETTVYTIV